MQIAIDAVEHVQPLRDQGTPSVGCSASAARFSSFASDLLSKRLPGMPVQQGSRSLKCSSSLCQLSHPHIGGSSISKAALPQDQSGHVAERLMRQLLHKPAARSLARWPAIHAPAARPACRRSPSSMADGAPHKHGHRTGRACRTPQLGSKIAGAGPQALIGWQPVGARPSKSGGPTQPGAPPSHLD